MWRPRLHFFVAVFLLLLLALIMTTGCWRYEDTTTTSPASSLEQAEVLHFNRGVPPAEDYLANPAESIYDESKGFSADAVKVLTQASLQLSLERYRLNVGSYPPSLDDLFPTYAPTDQDGQLLTAPPEGYAYTQTGNGAGYNLTVTLSAGKPYTVHQPDTVLSPIRSGD